MVETHPFPLFAPKNMEYLLLGSFTASSLLNDPNYDWYYGSKRNQFWKILSKVYDRPLLDIQSKQSLFEELHLGIGDLILSCERSAGNSMDSNLVNIVYNPNVKKAVNNKLSTIYFSSRFVENLYKKAFKEMVARYPGISLVTLPSPSPRYARISFAEKVELYKSLLPQLKQL